MPETHHSIKVVAQRTGLSSHVIRIWERRYGAVTPQRTGTNRRVYSDADIERLSLLHQATAAGHSIGNIAQLPKERLEKLAAEVLANPPAVKAPARSAEHFIEECLGGIRALNTRHLEEALGQAIVAFGLHGLLERVIGPLAQRIGELWRDGTLMAAHEHFASAVIRNFLGRNSKPFAPSAGAPTLVVGTPAGQLHELGAVMVAAAANDLGWRVIYLGPSLPAAELAGAALQHQARAVALSLVYPEDDPNLPAELENLRHYLPTACEIIVGGRAAPAYAVTLEKVKAVQPRQFKDIYKLLDALRLPPEPTASRSG